jgi:hypothetical protein
VNGDDAIRTESQQRKRIVERMHDLYAVFPKKKGQYNLFEEKTQEDDAEDTRGNSDHGYICAIWIVEIRIVVLREQEEMYTGWKAQHSVDEALRVYADTGLLPGDTQSIDEHVHVELSGSVIDGLKQAIGISIAFGALRTLLAREPCRGSGCAPVWP